MTKRPGAVFADRKIRAVVDLGRGLFGHGAPRSTRWTDVEAHDIYARATYCKKCGDPIHAAHGKRNTDNYFY